VILRVDPAEPFVLERVAYPCWGALPCLRLLDTVAVVVPPTRRSFPAFDAAVAGFDPCANPDHRAYLCRVTDDIVSAVARHTIVAYEAAPGKPPEAIRCANQLGAKCNCGRFQVLFEMQKPLEILYCSAVTAAGSVNIVMF